MFKCGEPEMLRVKMKKELLKGRYNVKHYQIGSVLLALMILGALGGMGVTYINNGKLFFGPHLLAGLGMTGMIAVSASTFSLHAKRAQLGTLHPHCFECGSFSTVQLAGGERRANCAKYP